MALSKPVARPKGRDPTEEEKEKILEAAQNDDVNSLEGLIKSGINVSDVYFTSEDNWTALHETAQQGSYNVMSILIRSGANVIAVTTRDQWTPLHWAASNAHTNCVALLVTNGADVNMKDDAGTTPLQLAVLFRQSSVVAYLVNEAGVKTTQYNKRTQDKIRRLLKVAETSTDNVDKRAKSPDPQALEKLLYRNLTRHKCFHLMFYYLTTRVEGMCDFVFVDRQWLFEKLTKLVELKFTKGYSREDVSAEDVEKFTMEGRLSINIIKKLNIDLQDDLEECYGAIQHVPLLVGFKTGPMPHGFFCHLIVELFRNLPKGWNRPFLSTEEMQHVYNNLITFPTASGHFVSIFYKIGYLEVQVRHQQCQPAIHGVVLQEVDKSLRVVSDYLQLNPDLLCYGFYCSCRESQHFIKLDKLALPMECIQCRYSNTKLTDDHKVWLQDIKCHKFEQEIKLIKNDQPNYQNLLPYFEDVDNWKKLGLYLLPEKYTSRINDIEKNYPHDVAQCRLALIREYLKVGEISWHKVIDTFEKSGNPNIAKKIRSDMFNIDDLSTTLSSDHERHDQSTTSDTRKATKPLASHEGYKHSPDTSASDADLCTEPSTDQRGHVQSHTTVASKPSAKRRCL